MAGGTSIGWFVDPEGVTVSVHALRDDSPKMVVRIAGTSAFQLLSLHFDDREQVQRIVDQLRDALYQFDDALAERPVALVAADGAVP